MNSARGFLLAALIIATGATTSVVTASGMAAVRNLAAEMGVTLPQGDRVSLLGRTFQLGDRPAIRTEPSQGDVEQIASAVSNGRRLSDMTIVSIHAHEGADGTFNTPVPGQFLVTFAHAMIDAITAMATMVLTAATTTRTIMMASATTTATPTSWRTCTFVVE